MTRVAVDHLIHRGSLELSGTFFDYVTHGGGVSVVAENAHLRLVIPVARGVVRGLELLEPACVLKHGPLPGGLIPEIVDIMREDIDREILLVLRWTPAGYRLMRPPQVRAEWRVEFQPVEDAIVEIHSHRGAAGRFSAIDTSDEQRFRIYGVVGLLDLIPEWSFRAGCYGHFMGLPPEVIFDIQSSRLPHEPMRDTSAERYAAGLQGGEQV